MKMFRTLAHTEAHHIFFLQIFVILFLTLNFTFVILGMSSHVFHREMFKDEAKLEFPCQEAYKPSKQNSMRF